MVTGLRLSCEVPATCVLLYMKCHGFQLVNKSLARMHWILVLAAQIMCIPSPATSAFLKVLHKFCSPDLSRIGIENDIVNVKDINVEFKVNKDDLDWVCGVSGEGSDARETDPVPKIARNFHFYDCPVPSELFTGPPLPLCRFRRF